MSCRIHITDECRSCGFTLGKFGVAWKHVHYRGRYSEKRPKEGANLKRAADSQVHARFIGISSLPACYRHRDSQPESSRKIVLNGGVEIDFAANRRKPWRAGARSSAGVSHSCRKRAERTSCFTKKRHRYSVEQNRNERDTPARCSKRRPVFRCSAERAYPLLCRRRKSANAENSSLTSKIDSFEQLDRAAAQSSD